MKFTIRFQALELPNVKNPRVFKSNQCNYGFEHVDLVRSKFNSNISIEDIDYRCHYDSIIVSYELTETDVIKCGQIFYNINEINIFIVPFSFQKYLKLEYTPIYSRTLIPIFKKLSEVKIKETLDWSRIIDDWCEHNCPLVWDPRKLNGVPDEEVLNFISKNE